MTFKPTNSLIYLVLFDSRWDAKVEWDRIGVQVRKEEEYGVCKLGAYRSCKGTGLPDSLIFQTSELNLLTGVVDEAVEFATSPGHYYLAFAGSTTMSVLSSVLGSDALGNNSSFEPGTMITSSFTYAGQDLPSKITNISYNTGDTLKIALSVNVS